MSLTLATTLLLTQLGLQTADAPPPAVDLDALEACEDSLDIAIFNTPRRPHARLPLRVMIVSDKDLGAARILARDPDGAQRELQARPYGGPPWGWVAGVDEPATGRWRVALVNDAGVQACQDILVRHRPSGSDDIEAGEASVWRSRIKWERDTENLYSLWIEHLFEAPLDADVSWNPLHVITRDADRNLLYNYLGLGEDEKDGLKLRPDCADFPYVLRGYFAWKLGLPMAFRPCRRGNAKRPPRCGDPFTNDGTVAEAGTRVAAFQKFVRKIRATVHSSSLRGLPEDEESDFYPAALNRHGLRPGTIYTDPYGHTMMVGRWYPQQGDRAGVLMAIDAQPDGTIGRRIFWRGSFMFPEDDNLAGAGWKRFRPVRKERDGVEVLDNSAITASVDYGDFSLEQWKAGKEGFYERMDAVINPAPLAPERALLATIDALEQQVSRRVESVDNGEKWIADNRGKTMKMPDGGAIFITSGPWEDYSTPSRDMRLLIAIDTVRRFPARVTRHPDRFVIPEGETAEQVTARLETLLREEAKRRTFEYTRSDGSTWTLSLADVLDRAVGFEMGYNPNDCVEIRWAAPEGSDERAPCQRHASRAHREKMESYRPWFQKRERPLH